MSDTKHTQGEWVVSNRDQVYTDDFSCLIADCEGNRDGLPTNSKTCIANALLIAASPDLLKVAENCEQILGVLFDRIKEGTVGALMDDMVALKTGRTNHNGYMELVAAIAKAKGE